jgi:hypothetical protein
VAGGFASRLGATPTDAVPVLTGAKANAAPSIDLACIYGGASTRTYEVSAPVPPLATFLDLLLGAFACVFQLAHGGLSRINFPAALARLFPAWWIALSAHVSPQLSPLALILVLLVAARVVRAWAASAPVESVTAIRGVGLQIATRPSRTLRSLFGGASPSAAAVASGGGGGIGSGTVRRVLDLNTIDAIVIHEGYFRHRCVYFLAVVVRDEPRSVVLFADTLPRLEALRIVLRGLRHVLHGTPEFGPTVGQADATHATTVSHAVAPASPTGRAPVLPPTIASTAAAAARGRVYEA